MGHESSFRCNKCGYSVLTSAGHDCGMLAVTDTYICKGCHNIVDVVVGIYGTTYLKSDIPQLLKELTMNLDFYTCPECGSVSNLIKWQLKRRPCPKCDGKMEVDNKGSVFMWD